MSVLKLDNFTLTHFLKYSPKALAEAEAEVNAKYGLALLEDDFGFETFEPAA